MSSDAKLSILQDAKPSDLVFSLLQAYGGERGGELPGPWFVDMLAPLEVLSATVRQTLYRMEKSGALSARREGSMKLYRLSSYGKAGTDAGTSRMLQAPEAEWNGDWFLVSYRFTSAERSDRDMIKGLLDLEGFGCLSRGTYLHPRDRTHRILRAARDNGVDDRLTILRARQVDTRTDRRLARELWDLEELAEGYRSFIHDFSSMTRVSWKKKDPVLVLKSRFAFVLRYLEIAWRDPGLPLELLPTSWPASRAQQIASTLHRDLSAPFLEHGDRVMERAAPSLASRDRRTKSARIS